MLFLQSEKWIDILSSQTWTKSSDPKQSLRHCLIHPDPLLVTLERLSGFDHDNSLTVKSMEALIRLQLSRVNTFSANESAFKINTNRVWERPTEGCKHHSIIQIWKKGTRLTAKAGRRQGGKTGLGRWVFTPPFSRSRRLRCELQKFQQFTFSSRPLSEIKKVAFSPALKFL